MSRRPSSGANLVEPTKYPGVANMDETTRTQSWLPSFLRKSKSQKGSQTGSPPNEESSLLPKPISSDDREGSQGEGEMYDLDDGNKSKPKLVLEEFMLLLKNSAPVILAYTLQNSLQTISVLIVGRLSPEDLATAAFSYMFAMSTAWLIALGGTTALDTLCSSSFTGSKNPHELGVLLQRAFIVLGLFYVPVAILWLCSEPVFKLLGQEDDISKSSCHFLSVLIPGGLGYIYFEALKKYLQAQGTHSETVRQAHC